MLGSSQLWHVSERAGAWDRGVGSGGHGLPGKRAGEGEDKRAREEDEEAGAGEGEGEGEGEGRQKGRKRGRQGDTDEEEDSAKQMLPLQPCGCF
jgi:hypothetical protein